MSKRHRIIFVCNVDSFFLSHRINLAQRCLAEGWDVYLLCRVCKHGLILKQHGIRTIHIPFPRSGMPLITLLYCFLGVCLQFWLLRPQIVHLISPLCNILGGCAARILRVPKTVIAISGFGSSLRSDTGVLRARKRVILFLYATALQGKNVTVICQSEHDLSVAAALSLPKTATAISVPGSGVDLEKFAPPAAPANSPVVLLACRLLRSKGVEHFLQVAESFAVYPSTRCTPRFVLAGSFDTGNSDCISREQVRDCHRRGVIRYVGADEDIAELLGAAGLFFYPSVYGEGLPKVLCEAAACGVPVITTDHPGCRDAVEAGVTALVLPAVTVEQSREAIEELLTNHKMRQRLSRAARDLAERKFDINLITEQQFIVYTS